MVLLALLATGQTVTSSIYALFQAPVRPSVAVADRQSKADVESDEDDESADDAVTQTDTRVNASEETRVVQRSNDVKERLSTTSAPESLDSSVDDLTSSSQPSGDKIAKSNVENNSTNSQNSDAPAKCCDVTDTERSHLDEPSKTVTTQDVSLNDSCDTTSDTARKTIKGPALPPDFVKQLSPNDASVPGSDVGEAPAVKKRRRQVSVTCS